MRVRAPDNLTIRFAAMTVLMAGVFIPRVLSVMNGNIVALCGVDVESMNRTNCNDDLEVSSPRVLLRPLLLTCYGFEILRGVDTEKEQLFVNTPLSASLMKHVNCLMGCTHVPRSLLQLRK